MGFTEIAYLGLGSNLGDRMGHLRDAVERLKVADGLRIVRISPVYETDPWKVIDQPQFLNAVVKIECELSPKELLATVKDVEVNEGRQQRASRWIEREIDIDILIFGKVELDIDELTVPHQRIFERRFVLQPLSDIAPELVIPRFNITVRAALEKCPDTGNVYLFRETLRV